MNLLQKNVGKTDRMIRLVVGILFAILALTGVVGWWGWIIALVGILTGGISSCPIYTLLGKNTLGK